MHKRGSSIKIFALLFGLLALSAMSSCPDGSSRGDANQSGSESQGGNAGGGMGGDSGGDGGGY